MRLFAACVLRVRTRDNSEKFAYLSDNNRIILCMYVLVSVSLELNRYINSVFLCTAKKSNRLSIINFMRNYHMHISINSLANVSTSIYNVHSSRPRDFNNIQMGLKIVYG